MRLINKIEEIIFPPSMYCICCGKYIDKSRTYSLCDHCIRRMNFKMTCLRHLEESGYFNHAAAVMGYGIYERQIIFGLKYNGYTYIARNIGDIFYDCLKKQLEETGECPWLCSDVIVPVPINKLKLKDRGFNQAEKMAVYLGKRTNIKVLGDGLERVKYTKAQRGLSEKERYINLDGAFRINPLRVKQMTGKRVLLIDDICTTGATALNCGRCLVDNGALEVNFLSLSSARNKEHGLNSLQISNNK